MADLAVLVGIPQYELVGLDRRFTAGMRRCRASIDMRVVQSILESELFSSFRQFA